MAIEWNKLRVRQIEKFQKPDTQDRIEDKSIPASKIDGLETPNNGKLTLKDKDGTIIGTFTANQQEDTTVTVSTQGEEPNNARITLKGPNNLSDSFTVNQLEDQAINLTTLVDNTLAGNTTSNEVLYLTGTPTSREISGTYDRTFVHRDVYMRNGVIYGEVNNYRYVKNGSWNTLNGNLIKDLYNEDYLNASITSSNDTDVLENPTMGVRYLRLGRIYSGASTRGFDCTMLLHVHSQKVKLGTWGSSFTCFISKGHNDPSIKVKPLILNNDPVRAKYTFLKIWQTQETIIDGLKGVDLVLEYDVREGNNSIVATAIMLSDSADLYQGQDYEGSFDFTYSKNLYKEYMEEHPDCLIPSDDSGKYNKSPLYVSNHQPDILDKSYSLEPSDSRSSEAITPIYKTISEYNQLSSLEINKDYFITDQV